MAGGRSARIGPFRFLTTDYMSHMVISPEQIADVLGGPPILGRRVTSMRELDEVVRAGMPRSALDAFIEALRTGREDDFAIRLRNRIVPRTVYERVDRLNLQVSETTERMARLYAMTLAVFEEPAAAIRFLAGAHRELGIVRRLKLR